MCRRLLCCLRSADGIIADAPDAIDPMQQDHLGRLGFAFGSGFEIDHAVFVIGKVRRAGCCAQFFHLSLKHFAEDSLRAVSFVDPLLCRGHQLQQWRSHPVGRLEIAVVNGCSKGEGCRQGLIIDIISKAGDAENDEQTEGAEYFWEQLSI